MKEFSPIPIIDVLIDHHVRFVVIGGYAAIVQGSAIVTQDLDICYARDRANLEVLTEALKQMGARLRGVHEDLPFRLDAKTLGTGDTFAFETKLGDFDILGTPSGTQGYEDLAANAPEFEIAGKKVRVASVDDLIRMKRAAGRAKDRMMVEELGALREEIQKKERRRR